MYGRQAALASFTQKQWSSTRGWKYSVSTGQFTRPDTKNLITTLAYDNNLSAIRRLQSLELSQETEQVAAADTPIPPAENPQQPSGTENRYQAVDALLENESQQSEQESGMSRITQEALAKENEMVHKIRQQNIEAQQQFMYKDNPVHQVETDGNASDVSSITKLSEGSLSDDESLGSLSSIQSVSSKTTEKSSKFSFSLQTLNNIIKPDMTYQQAKDTAEAYFSHRQNRAVSQKDQLLYTFLQSRFPTEALQENSEQTDEGSTASTNTRKAGASDDGQQDPPEDLESSLTNTVEHQPQQFKVQDLVTPEESSLAENSLQDLSTITEPPGPPPKPPDTVDDQLLLSHEVPASSHNTGSQP